MANKCILAALLLVAATSCTLVGARENSALFAKLDNYKLTIEEIQSILESAKEDVEVNSIEVEDMLALKSAHLAACEIDQLQKYLYLHDHFRDNTGANKYIDSKLRSLLELCVKNLDAIKAGHEAKFDQTDREYIRGLAGAAMKATQEMDNELKYGQSSEVVDQFIASLPGKKKTVKEAQRTRLFEACRHLVVLLVTPGLIVSEARRRDIQVEFDSDASLNLPHQVCRDLIYKTNQQKRFEKGSGATRDGEPRGKRMFSLW